MKNNSISFAEDKDLNEFVFDLFKDSEVRSDDDFNQLVLLSVEIFEDIREKYVEWKKDKLKVKPLERFLDEFIVSYSKPVVLAVVKQYLKEQGKDTYSRNYHSARKLLTKALETKTFSTEKLMLALDLKPKRSKIRKKSEDYVSLNDGE